MGGGAHESMWARSEFQSGKGQDAEGNAQRPTLNVQRPIEDLHLERLFLENDFHSFARELRTGEAPLT